MRCPTPNGVAEKDVPPTRRYLLAGQHIELQAFGSAMTYDFFEQGEQIVPRSGIPVATSMFLAAGRN